MSRPSEIETWLAECAENQDYGDGDLGRNITAGDLRLLADAPGVITDLLAENTRLNEFVYQIDSLLSGYYTDKGIAHTRIPQAWVPASMVGSINVPIPEPSPQLYTIAVDAGVVIQTVGDQPLDPPVKVTKTGWFDCGMEDGRAFVRPTTNTTHGYQPGECEAAPTEGESDG